MSNIVRTQVNVIGLGVTEQLAKMDAYNKLKASYNQNVLVLGMLNSVQNETPVAGTQCKTDNFKPDGARKWVTVHNVYVQNPNDVNDWKKVNSFDNKTDAVKYSKEMALKTQSTLKVELAKELSTPQEHIEAIVNPKNAKPGSWTITLDIVYKMEDNATNVTANPPTMANN